MRTFLTILVGVSLVSLVGCTAIQRKFVFFPGHENRDSSLAPWIRDGRIIGCSRQVTSPETVWLMLHGNAGQAADRSYAIPSFSEHDSVFILEYPGYGLRSGKPSKASLDAAAAEAYLFLRKTFPRTPLCVMAESIGSGPACALASQSQPPDKIVLVVPFDTLPRVAADHVPLLPVGLIWGASWDNIRSLSKYKGPVEIFGALQDAVIPIKHARALANSIPSAKFHSIQGGHNDWSKEGRVAIRNP
jgi:pimeloyl-ACP methyl ester carboxylesterase